MNRPAPGQQLAAGRVRVDASKAIAKLREYQLVDRTAWILEAIRAAVAAGATHIDLQGDANDVWLAWSGTPWPAEDLPRLFDELVSPEPGAARHHVRLLASAINSALGANPAYIDVYAIGDDGAMRARYTPDVLDVSDASPTDLPAETPLQRVRAVAAEIPRGATKGMFVHYRRRTSLEVMSYWLRLATPPELAMALTACADIATPIRIGGMVLDRAKCVGDIVRVPLDDDIDGFLAITDPTAAPPVSREVLMGIAERGVLLATMSLDLQLPASTGPIPIRVLIDGPRMPTNASRSEVRRDTHPISTAERRAKDRLPELVGALVAKLAAAEVESGTVNAAKYLVGATIRGSDWAHRVREIGPPLKALADLPLVRDAAGVARPIAWPWNGLVHIGSSPLAEDLAPWLSHVLWVLPSDQALAFARWAADPTALKRYLKGAKRERRALRNFYKHAPREAVVEGRRKPRVRARLGAPLPGSSVPDETFADLTGAVCL
jgi:hypothetical protein